MKICDGLMGKAKVGAGCVLQAYASVLRTRGCQ